jgi:hypothetical protein
MRSRLLCSAILLASAGLPFSPALAQRTKTVVPEIDAEGHKGEMARAAKEKANERFNKADANNDGFVTREEATATLPFIAENFEKYDKNKDGKMSWEEYLGHDKWKREPAK